MNPQKTPKSPWPTKDAMRQIYEKNLWGGQPHEFYSGEGSHRPEIIEPFLDAVKSFLTSFETPINVFDLGCGDFNVGKHLVEFTENYIAIDIVPELIERNRATFMAEKLEFHCLDLATDDFPPAYKKHCVIVRQVLQHLSNVEVKSILNKLRHFNYLILSEHLPEGAFTPNLDIISGQGIRLKKQSGLIITQEPFLFPSKREQELVTTQLPDGKSKIVTTLFEID